MEPIQPIPHPPPSPLERRIQINSTQSAQPAYTAGWINPTPLEEKPPLDTAQSFLEEAVGIMKARAAIRDKPQGERSMEAIVNSFNGATGHKLTEEDGWLFMVLLKAVRGRQGFYNRDDYLDGAAYFALMGESASKNMPRKTT